MAGRGGKIGTLVEDVIKPLFKESDDVARRAHAPRASNIHDAPGTTPGRTSAGSGPATRSSRRNDADFRRLQKKWEEGRQFNAANAHRFQHNEVTLSNGKRLDSYNRGRERVSRKNTQLAEVQPETVKAYLREFRTKYNPEAEVLPTEHNGLAGGTQLGGSPVLEVPKQNVPIPAWIQEYAFNEDVVIREV